VQSIAQDRRTEARVGAEPSQPVERSRGDDEARIRRARPQECRSDRKNAAERRLAVGQPLDSKGSERTERTERKNAGSFFSVDARAAFMRIAGACPEHAEGARPLVAKERATPAALFLSITHPMSATGVARFQRMMSSLDKVGAFE
jgi:hypothetical protein